MRLIRGVETVRQSARRPGARAVRLLGVAYLVVAGACAAASRSAPEEEGVSLNGDAATGSTKVRVENHNLNDITVYVYQGSQRTRLGRVSGSATSALVVPARLVNSGQQLRFLAQPTGNQRSILSELVSVSPGDIVEFYVPSR